MSNKDFDTYLKEQMPCPRHQSHSLREQNLRCIQNRRRQPAPQKKFTRLLTLTAVLPPVAAIALALFSFLPGEPEQSQPVGNTGITGSEIVLMSFEEVHEELLWSDPAAADEGQPF